MELGNVSNRSSQGFDNPVYDIPPPFEDSFTVTYDASGDQVGKQTKATKYFVCIDIVNDKYKNSQL